MMIRFLLLFLILGACCLQTAAAAPTGLAKLLMGVGVPAGLALLFALATGREVRS